MPQLRTIGKTEEGALHPSHIVDVTFEGVFIKSVESFFISLRVQNKKHQANICSQNPETALRMVASMTKRPHLLAHETVFYWKGEAFKRDSDQADVLIDQFFDCLIENDEFAVELAQHLNCRIIMHPRGLRNICTQVSRENYARRIEALMIAHKKQLSLRTYKEEEAS